MVKFIVIGFFCNGNWSNNANRNGSGESRSGDWQQNTYFTLDSLTSKNVELYQVITKNKVTLINFWGMWCPYCVQEIPELVKFYKQYHQTQVEILAVNVGDNPKEVPLFVKNNQMAFPVLIDKNNAVSTLYQVSGFPTTFIINRQGKIKDMIVGGTNQATLIAKVETVLREK